MKPIFATLSLLCMTALSACAKLDTPEPGTYRAVLTLKGGEAPLLLQISGARQNLQLTVVAGHTSLHASDVQAHEGQLHAVLPNRFGELQAKLQRGGLSGEWHMTDAQGKTIAVPFKATLGENYRFVEKSLTDNADVSGYWNLNAANMEAATLQLSQTHDSVDGMLMLADKHPAIIYGQVHGDDVYFTVMRAGEVSLMTGKVTMQGDLQGKLWTNLNDAESWSAKRSEDDAAESAVFESDDDDTRKVAFPWPIPTK